MLVGDVRCAAPLGGSSWTLSGGRWLSTGPMYVSKYRHVLRATVRRKTLSSLDSRGRGACIGRLIHHAIDGENAHSVSTGAATASASRRNATSAMHTTSAATGRIHIDA